MASEHVPLTEWRTGALFGFIRDELDGSSWSRDLNPGVLFKDVVAEVLRRCDNVVWLRERRDKADRDLHIVTSADKKVLDALAKCSESELDDYPLANNLGDALNAETERRNSPKD